MPVSRILPSPFQVDLLSTNQFFALYFACCYLFVLWFSAYCSCSLRSFLAFFRLLHLLTSQFCWSNNLWDFNMFHCWVSQQCLVVGFSQQTYSVKFMMLIALYLLWIFSLTLLSCLITVHFVPWFAYLLCSPLLCTVFLFTCRHYKPAYLFIDVLMLG